MNPDHALLRDWTAPVSAAHCSALSAALDVRVDAVDRVRGRVMLAFALSRGLRDADGVANERAIAAMLDYALSFAAMATLDPPTAIVTATLRIDRLAWSSDARFVADGSIEGRSGSTIVVGATLVDASGTHVALARASLRVI